MKKLLMGIVTVAMLAGCTQKQEPLKAVIFPGDYPDPTIMRDGNDFYMTHSCFTYYPGLLVWHSTDLVNWEPISRAVQGQSYSIFAPDMCKVGDKYYIYYPSSDGRNFVVTADSPKGPWSEPVQIRVSGIDPGHVVAENGKRYLYTNNGHVVELTDDGLAAAGRNQKVYDGWEFPSDWETEGMWLESPKLVKRGDYYYLISAEGGTAGPVTSHMCVVARSKSALGPWENSPYNPMVHTYSGAEEWWSKGHGTLIDDAEGNWYIVYHAYRNGFHTLGRSTIVESVEWTKDGWPVLAEKDGAKWDNNGFVTDLNYLRDFSNPIMWAKWEPGFMDGTLWTTTAIDKSYEIQAEFDLDADSKAGLYLFYNEEANAGVTAQGDVRFLRIVNNENRMSAWTSTNGTDWTEQISDLDVSEWHHNTYQGFFALRPAYLLTEGAKLRSFSYKAMGI
ncbi:MAG: family 43 glycosylhydrolase [Bacteroidaceae bacterium]|nr:family 43 glycosylhydrolase [Bacteroidaceae bacterium]